MDFPAYSVLSYNKNSIISFIREKTGSDNRSEISGKNQLVYLFYYLEKIKAKTIFIESEYINKHYLEDYSEYYVRCFHKHSKICSRIHFFDDEITSSEFAEGFENKSKQFVSKLDNSYLGFIVIRPIVNAFLANISLIPYRKFDGNPEYKILTNKNNISLFGIDLTVNTIPLQEQDKVVAACATSAVWCLLNASNHIHKNYLPSPSAITKAAEPLYDLSTRIFPNKGLTPGQVSKSLKEYGLESTILSFDNKKLEGKELDEKAELDLIEIKENIYSHIQNDIPILLGGDIYAKNSDGKAELLGKHLVCVLGFKLENDNNIKNDEDLKLKAHFIESLYIHDDRYGPYLKVDLKFEDWECENDNKKQKGLVVILNDGGCKHLFMPDLLIFGLYHKVRIPYTKADYICKRLHAVIDQICEFTKTQLDEENEFKEKIKIYSSILNSTWKIELTTNNKLKSEILENESWYSSSQGAYKKHFLAMNMPRYIWRVKIEQAGVLISELHLDATEVPDGNILFSYIAYNVDAHKFWGAVDNDVKNRVWDDIYAVTTEEQEKSAISTIMRFFMQSDDQSVLNTLYGPVNYPDRELKDGEIDVYENVSQRPDLYIVRRDNQFDEEKQLDRSTKYIWVITKNGDLTIGEDIYVNDGGKEKYLGHPTLIDGAPARIGGELKYSHVDKSWLINAFSGAYSKHLNGDEKTARVFLENVIKHNFYKFDIEITFKKL